MLSGGSIHRDSGFPLIPEISNFDKIKNFWIFVYQNRYIFLDLSDFFGMST